MYFEAKINYVKTHENGQVKKTTEVYLVKADNIEHAKRVLTDGMKGTMIDYRIAAIKESNITDIIDEQ